MALVTLGLIERHRTSLTRHGPVRLSLSGDGLVLRAIHSPSKLGTRPESNLGLKTRRRGLPLRPFGLIGTVEFNGEVNGVKSVL